MFLVLSFLTGNLFFFFLGIIEISGITAIPKCVIYHKMGRGWWEALIPIWNEFVYYQQVFGNGWWILAKGILAIVSLAVAAVQLVVLGVLFSVIMLLFDLIYSLRLSFSFGKGNAFGIGLWIPCIRVILMFILALGKSEYHALESFQIKAPFSFVQKQEAGANDVKNMYGPKRCPACGQVVNDGARFCLNCGNEIH